MGENEAYEHLEEGIFQSHYNYYKNIGIETIQQQAGQVEQVSSDYQGRVIYELLQNAFDKAHKRIIVQVIDNKLYVANDGQKFTYTAGYDYNKNTSVRGDFQSLCSISTSTKNASESIGNKGVGFKSVFSIAKDNYVNIYTQGQIIGKTVSPIDETISFRIYDSYKNTEAIPSEFSEEVGNSLKEKIKLVQTNFKMRGVPGFYFPLHIKEEPLYIKQRFEEGIVSIIEIPLANKEEVRALFTELKEVHFDFVRLKHHKYFRIEFKFEEEESTVKELHESNLLFAASINNDEILQLAKDAGIDVKEPQVAFYVREDMDGKMYNYLPTQVKSPFPYIDFHADFHTTVDRKSISLDGKIGQYNKALLRACLELYFSVLNNSLQQNEQANLNLIYFSTNSIKEKITDFRWRLLSLDRPYEMLFKPIRSILNIENNNGNSYGNAASFLGNLAYNYLNRSDLEGPDFTSFFATALGFIQQFSRDYNQRISLESDFKVAFAKVLKNREVRISHHARLSKEKELIYKKSTDSNIQLPSSLDINITDVEITDNGFREALGVKEFTDYNEIIKYFRQSSLSGEISSKRIKEEEQRELIKSLIQLFNSRREPKHSCSTHRYLRVFTAQDRDNNSTLNQASFNVSTVFLKTKKGQYKPAQLCRKNELDLSFFDWDDITVDLDAFLMYVGVSLDSTYVFADERIYDKLNRGLNYIPAPLRGNDEKEQLRGNLILNNIRVISDKGRKLHPALINDNNYAFLHGIASNKIENELDALRINNYREFPQEYLDILFSKVKSLPNGIDRLYMSLFSSFHTGLNQYLVSTNGRLEWKSSKDNFYIAQSRLNYDVLKKFDIPLLCFYYGNEIPEELSDRKITLNENDIISDGRKDISKEVLSIIESRMCYILAAVSNSNLSDMNFRNDSSRITEFQQLLHGCNVFECKKLFREISCNRADLKFESTAEALFDEERRNIFLVENCSKRAQAELFARYFFNNTSIASEIELILFFKTIEELELEFLAEDISLFKRLWIKDYNEKFIEFQTEILTGYIDLSSGIPSDWYIYNERCKSDSIIKLFNEGKLRELESRIYNAKQNYDSLFDDFKLEIDYSLNDKEISGMISFLEQVVDEYSKELIIELKNLAGYIGKEARIEAIEKDIYERYQYNTSDSIDKATLSAAQKKLDTERRVDGIFNKLPSVVKHNTIAYTADGESELSGFNVKRRKLIFQGEGESSNNDHSLNETGANGEELVLGYYINQFILLSTKKRKEAIESIYSVLKPKLGDDSHDGFKSDCLMNIDNDESLKKALIPYFYIAMHHKFAYFDIIAYENDVPIIIEVKTTQNKNNDSFFISISEVNEALKEPNYKIIRVTPTEVIFMGNPIKQLEDKLVSVSGNNYKLIPRNYKFEFSK